MRAALLALAAAASVTAAAGLNAAPPDRAAVQAGQPDAARPAIPAQVQKPKKPPKAAHKLRKAPPPTRSMAADVAPLKEDTGAIDAALKKAAQDCALKKAQGVAQAGCGSTP
jgi:cell pole-organizing protein PopZ